MSVIGEELQGLPFTWRNIISHLELTTAYVIRYQDTGSSKKMDVIWNRYNLKSTGRIYTFGVLKCSEKFKVLDSP